MDQEKFIGKYVELLNSTLTESFQKNIVAQAQRRTLEEELDSLQKDNSRKEEALKNLNLDLTRTKEQLNEEKTKVVRLTGEAAKITGLNSEISQLRTVVCNKDNTIKEKLDVLSKKNLEIETHKKTIDELNNRIKSIIEDKPIVLQNNIKRKTAIKKLSKTTTINANSNTITKDAGNF